MSHATTRIPVEVSFVTFNDDDLPVTSVAEYKKDGDRGGGGAAAGADNSFALTTGSFPHEIILTTRSSFANVKRIELTLDEAKDIVVERCLFNSDGGSSSAGADPMSATYEVVGERHLSRGETIGSSSLPNNKKDAAVSARRDDDDDLRPRKPQVELLELDPAGAGKGIRAVKLRILSGYSDFVGILGIAVYGEESEQRIAVMESKAEVNM